MWGTKSPEMALTAPNVGYIAPNVGYKLDFVPQMWGTLPQMWGTTFNFSGHLSTSQPPAWSGGRPICGVLSGPCTRGFHAK